MSGAILNKQQTLTVKSNLDARSKQSQSKMSMMPGVAGDELSDAPLGRLSQLKQNEEEGEESTEMTEEEKIELERRFKMNRMQ